MWAYIARRLLWAIPVVLGTVTFIFIIMQIMPGDIALVILGSEEGMTASPEQIAQLRTELGLDRPLYVRYLEWLWGVARLDLGRSLWTGEPLTHALAKRFPVSFQLAVMAVLLSMILAVPSGIIMAIKQDSVIDYFLRGVFIAGLSIPSFWFAILIVLFLVVIFGWYPPLGYATFLTDPKTSFLQLIFPAIALGYRHTAVAARMTRSTMLEVIREDYVRTARAKGLRESAVITGHALKNAILPVITVFGMDLALLIGGIVIIERVFNLPGVGDFLVEGILTRDLPVVQGTIALIILGVVVVNLIVDITYSWFDPRIRYR